MARSTPTVDGDKLYTISSDGDVTALEVASGKVLWQKSLRRDFGGQPGTWGYAESPLIDGDVLVATPGGEQATMVALNKKTGAAIWKSAVPGGDRAGYASASVIEAAGRKQYVQFLDKGVVGVDAKTGQFLWRYGQSSGGPANIAMPVSRGDLVYSTNARRFGGGLVHLVATGGVASRPRAGLFRTGDPQHPRWTSAARRHHLRHQSGGALPPRTSPQQSSLEGGRCGPRCGLLRRRPFVLSR